MEIKKNKDSNWLIPKSDITFEYLTKFNRNMGILRWRLIS